MMTSQRLAQVEYGKMNVLVVPTAPMHPTKAEYLADPIGLNHRLGKVRTFLHPFEEKLVQLMSLSRLVYALRQRS